MTYYTEHIKPRMLADPEHTRQVQSIAKLTRQLEDAKTDLANWEAGYILNNVYPSSAD